MFDSAVEAVTTLLKDSATLWTVERNGSLLSAAAGPLRVATARLINRERLEGQPPCTPEHVLEAFAGRSSVDSGFWEELGTLNHLFVADGDGNLVGACAFGVAVDGTVKLPWMYGTDPGALSSMLSAVDRTRDGRKVEAFGFATALTLGLEGLAVRSRPAAHQAMLDAGYTPHDGWAYMVRDNMDGDWPGDDVAEVGLGEGRAVELKTRGRNGELLAEAEVEVASDGTGVLWWLWVEPPARGTGLGRGIFNQAMRQLVADGATRAVLYVDDDDPVERNRDRAKQMYSKAGFVEVDRLFNYDKG